MLQIQLLYRVNVDKAIHTRACTQRRTFHVQLMLLIVNIGPYFCDNSGLPFSQGEETLSVYLEYVSGGSIHKLLQEYGSFSEPVIQNYTRQIISGLAYLHGRNTVHRYVGSRTYGSFVFSSWHCGFVYFFMIIK